MRVFVDTSAWVKYFIDEEGTPAMQEFLLKMSAAEEHVISAAAITDDELQAVAQEHGLVVWNPVEGSFFEDSDEAEDSE